MTDDYIIRQAAIDGLNEQIACCDKALKSFGISMKDEYAVKVERASLAAYKEQLEALPTADVVSKADITALLEETEKELVKGTDDMSIARCFIVSIMGIVKCKIMQMGERKE